MRFDRESWRKLYVAESAEHRLLPALTRGLRDYLLRLASDDGTILSSTKDPKGDLVRLLNAARAERGTICKAYEDLIRIGYLSYENERLWVTKFRDAQTARTPGAKRQAEFKERHRKPSSVTSPDALPVTLPGDAPQTLQIDETRRDETTTTGGGNGQGPCPADLKLTDGQRKTLESSMIPGWAIDEITSAFVAKYQADQADRRTLVVWRKCLSTAVSSTWNDPNKRPRKPEAGESGMQLPKGVKFGAAGL